MPDTEEANQKEMKRAGTTAAAADGIPVAVIFPIYGDNNSLPPDFLFCNGGLFSRTLYEKLYGLLTTANPSLVVNSELAHLPDLRGEFLRGWVNDRLPQGEEFIDQGRKFGVLQQCEVQKHNHVVLGNVQFFRDGRGEFTSVEGNADINVSDPPTSFAGGLKHVRETLPSIT